jgi:hypothetical protein
MTPPKSPWLIWAILATVTGVIGLSLTHYISCQFWANPAAFKLYVDTDGRLPDSEHISCREVGPKTLASLTAMLATLLALHSDPPQ